MSEISVQGENMKTILAVLFATLLSIAASAQETKLPEMLRPDANSLSAAERSGIDVFKLLPRGMFEDKSGGRDEDNPIGIRGGAAYYSFTNRAHSYNKIPQIEYQQGHLMVGFYGANYGFVRDLGTGSLADLPIGSAVPKFLADYKPPILHDEIREEQRKSRKYETENGVFEDRVAAAVGHVYALRAISFGEADILVVFQVLQMDSTDGSLTIGWKRVREFDVPKLLHHTDEALRAKVAPLMNDPRYRDITFTAREDVVTLNGSIAAEDLATLLAEIKEKAGPYVRVLNRAGRR
jgi:hypothetical protein